MLVSFACPMSDLHLFLDCFRHCYCRCTFRIRSVDQVHAHFYSIIMTSKRMFLDFGIWCCGVHDMVTFTCGIDVDRRMCYEKVPFRQKQHKARKMKTKKKLKNQQHTRQEAAEKNTNQQELDITPVTWERITAITNGSKGNIWWYSTKSHDSGPFYSIKL